MAQPALKRQGAVRGSESAFAGTQKHNRLRAGDGNMSDMATFRAYAVQ